MSKLFFSQKTLKKQFQVKVKVLIQETMKLIMNTTETKKIMKMKNNVYRDTFFSHVEKLMKGETSKMQSYRFRVWTRTTSPFFQRKAEEESEIWSNIYGYIVYDAVQIPFIKWRPY